jgi:hypothetical protein
MAWLWALAMLLAQQMKYMEQLRAWRWLFEAIRNTALPLKLFGFINSCGTRTYA